MTKQEELMMELRELFSKMSWLNKQKMEKALSDYKSSEVHCIEYVGANEDANVTSLSKAFYMTRSAMSKVTKKLIEKDVIESYQRSGNKKEIYYRLTSKGRKVYETHEKLHKEFQDRDKVAFEEVTDKQFKDMLKFIDDYSKHLDNEITKVVKED